MLMSTENYIFEQKNKSYQELLKERKCLYRDICKFEKQKYNEVDLIVSPSPSTMYQCELEYLAALCELIAKKFCEEFVEEG